jgi:hypothetical protein
LPFARRRLFYRIRIKKVFFAVSAGASLPVGRFASCSSSDDQACMAGNGLAFNVSAGYRVAGPVGLMIRGEQHRNSVNTGAMLDALYRNDSDVWTAKADNWSIMTVMAGPYVSIPLTGRLSVDARLLAGRALAVLPNTSMSGTFGRTEMSVKTTGSQSTAMALGGGLSLRYRLGRSTALNVNADYSRADFTFTNLTSTAKSNNSVSQSSNYSSDRTIGVVSVSAGVAVLFGTKYRPF